MCAGVNVAYLNYIIDKISSLEVAMTLNWNSFQFLSKFYAQITEVESTYEKYYIKTIWKITMLFQKTKCWMYITIFSVRVSILTILQCFFVL